MVFFFGPVLAPCKRACFFVILWVKKPPCSRAQKGWPASTPGTSRVTCVAVKRVCLRGSKRGSGFKKGQNAGHDPRSSCCFAGQKKPHARRALQRVALPGWQWARPGWHSVRGLCLTIRVLPGKSHPLFNSTVFSVYRQRRPGWLCRRVVLRKAHRPENSVEFGRI